MAENSIQIDAEQGKMNSPTSTPVSEQPDESNYLPKIRLFGARMINIPVELQIIGLIDFSFIMLFFLRKYSNKLFQFIIFFQRRTNWS